MRIEWRIGAELELTESAEWYELKRGGLGDKFLADVESRLRSLTEHPFIGRGIDERHRQYRLKKFQYALIYRVEGDVLIMSAVAHGSRRPGYWRDDPPGVREMPAPYAVKEPRYVSRAA